MTPREQRHALRERRRVIRAVLAQARRDARERLSHVPAVQRERRRRRIRRSAAVAALLLLILFVRCDCAEPAPPPSPPPAAAAVAKPVKPVADPPAKPPAFTDKIKPKKRGTFETATRPPPSWLEAFHLQVAARSPRLAACFNGTERPGALRWAAALNAKSGGVSDHELEPLGSGGSFTQQQRDCVVRALSSPTYTLSVPDSDALPRRVGLVIEF